MDAIPSEVLCEIFKYLSFNDRRKMALVNTKWYYASIHPVFARNEVFCYKEEKEMIDNRNGDKIITELQLIMFNEFKTMLLNSNRKCFNLSFSGIYYVNHVIPIFTNLADYIVSVRVSGLFTDVLKNAIFGCNKLEQLELKDVSKLEITNELVKPIPSLKRMYIQAIDFNDFFFNIFMQYAPNLEDLGLFGCHVLGWTQSLRRFYPNYKDSKTKQTYNSKSILSTVNVVNYLNTSKNIYSLKFDNSLDFILDLPEHIKLVSLEFNSNNPLCNISYQQYDKIGDKLSNFQDTLETLGFNCIPCCLLAVCIPKLYKLKSLKTNYFECGIGDQCIRKIVDSLKNKKNLRELVLYTSPNRPMLFPFTIADCTLEYLTSYTGPIDSVLTLVNKGQNLTYLKILNGYIITADGYKLLFKNLIKLRKLDIENCIHLDDNVLSEVPTHNLKALISLRLTHTKLTFQCFKYINILQLRELCITDLRLEPCIKMNNMLGIKKILKAFNVFTPELTRLEICVYKEINQRLDLEVIVCLPTLISYICNNFINIKKCTIH